MEFYVDPTQKCAQDFFKNVMQLKTGVTEDKKERWHTATTQVYTTEGTTQ